MQQELSFSIIIPTYNRADFILETLESVFQQRYRNFEVIVIDDGSTDNTTEIINKIQDPRLRVTSIPNSERGAARNAGIRLAKGDYITFVDSDDLIYPHYLTYALESLINLNLPVFFHQSYEVKNAHGSVVRYGNEVKGDYSNFLVKGNPLSCLGIFIRRKEALLHPFVEDRNLSGSEDWELWLRLAANFGIKTDDRITACLIIHDDRSVLSINEDKLLLRKNLALNYAFKDLKVQEVFGSSRNKMEAYCDTYIALHLVLSGQNLKGMKYLCHATFNYAPSVFQRRFLAIIKYMFLNLKSAAQS
ncbi:glycosyltransferase [soil metagenome]